MGNADRWPLPAVCPCVRAVTRTALGLRAPHIRGCSLLVSIRRGLAGQPLVRRRSRDVAQLSRPCVRHHAHYKQIPNC